MKTKHPTSSAFGRFVRSLLITSTLAGSLIGARTASAAFGLTTATDYYQVDTGAGLVFKIRRTNNGSSTQSPGDVMSLVWNGVEFQNQSRGSQINSGFDYLYSGISAVTVSAAVVNTNYIKITVTAGSLTHYYMARSGYPHIYMGTYFTAEPDTLGLCRYILRIPTDKLPNGPTPSDVRNHTGTLESGDIYVLANGQTRSKHYSNMRLKDWSYIGATGPSVGMWVVRDNNEGGSGGPFFRCLLNQCGDTNQEITYIVNYGEGQTEAFRTGILNTYTLVMTTGAAPGAVDTSWFSSMGLMGFVAPADRGRVTGVGIAGRDTNYTYTVGFANASAQYWTTAAASNGYFNCTGMIPGTYTMTIYKNELAVWTGSSTVTAGGTVAYHTITVTNDPSNVSPIWRIGDWDGTPMEMRNGASITTMHPSDVRLQSWASGVFTVGTNTPLMFPCYQWKGVNNNYQVQFTLTAAQAAVAHTVRIGITCAYAGGRPKIGFNAYASGLPAASSQPSTRTLTVGTYRGNNTTYSFTVPASAQVAGTNTLTITVISGSGAADFLSAGYSVDCVDFY